MAQPIHPEQAAALRGRWLWLFPASYAIHIDEKGLAGERFYRWIGRVTGREIGPGIFADVNLAYETAIVAAVRRVSEGTSPAVTVTRRLSCTGNGEQVRRRCSTRCTVTLTPATGASSSTCTAST